MFFCLLAAAGPFGYVWNCDCWRDADANDGSESGMLYLNVLEALVVGLEVFLLYFVDD
jgi:hypothetical protein